MDYSFLVGVHHRHMGDSINVTSFPQQNPQHQQQLAGRGRVEEEEYEDMEGGGGVSIFFKDDGGVQGADPNEVTLDV